MNNQLPTHRYAARLLAALLFLGGMLPAMQASAAAATSAKSAPPSTATSSATPAAPATPPAPDAAPPAPPDEAQESHVVVHSNWHHRHKSDDDDDSDDDDNSIFNLGNNSMLAAGQQADNVVSVLGNSTSDGDVTHDVVSVLGNTRVTGSVGDSAVAVLGNVYVDSKVENNVVAVLGTITLGPHADIGGNLVAVGGIVHRDPAAQVHGNEQNVALGRGVDRLLPWFEHCALLGRPLAFVSGIGWAWTLAFSALALYLFAALLFAPAVERCEQTLHKYPGQSLLAMILTIIATPIVFVILCITVIGIIAIPFLLIALFLIKFFGKLVLLAWIGRHLTRSVGGAQSSAMQTVAAVLVGGLLVMLLYCVPVLGIVLYYLLGMVGLGVVIYTLLQHMQERRAASGAADVPPPPPPPSFGSPGAEPAAGMAFAAEEPLAATPGADAGAAATNLAAAPTADKHGRISAAAALALPRAGFWIRMLALLLDMVLVAVVMHLIRASDDWFLMVLASYGVIMWRFRGSTVGGIVFNLIVVRRDGREMDWGTAVVRGLSSFLSLFALGLGFIWIAIDKDNRAWHDKIADTIVVRAP